MSGVILNEYQSLSFGMGQLNEKNLNQFLSFNHAFMAGVGIARFNFDDIKYRALAEISGDVGISVFGIMNLGLVLKYQVIGYPTETMATSVTLGINTGINF